MKGIVFLMLPVFLVGLPVKQVPGKLFVSDGQGRFLKKLPLDPAKTFV